MTKRIRVTAYGLLLVSSFAHASCTRNPEPVTRIQEDPRPINATEALPSIGETLPAFRAPLLKGGYIDQDALDDQPAVVAIWSTDCPGSRAVVRSMEALRQDFEQRGVRFLILATDTSAAAVNAFADSAKVGSLIARADEKTISAFRRSRWVKPSEPFQVVFSKPSFLIIGSDSRITARYGGHLNEKSARVALEQIADDAGH